MTASQRCTLRTLAVAVILGCAAENAQPPAPDVVLVSVSSLRSDALGASGGPLPTPTLDALAETGVSFETVVAPSPRSAPSHATLFTGLPVSGHGVREDGAALPEEALTLAEVFRAHGYRTAAFLSSPVLDPRLGWCQGFEHCDAELPREGRTFATDSAEGPRPERVSDRFERRAQATTEAVTAWLAGTEEPLFLFVHYADPSPPYDPPRRYRKQTARDVFEVDTRRIKGLGPVRLRERLRLYHADVRYVDDQLGALLAGVGAVRTRPLLVVVTADHGDGLGQHRRLWLADDLYEEWLRVPLLVHWRGRDHEPKRIPTAIGLADVAPTLAALAGLPALPGTGLSLAASIGSDDAVPARPVHAEVAFRTAAGELARAQSVRDGSWKLIRSPDGRSWLFDLGSDPQERRDESAAEPDRAARLTALLDSREGSKSSPGASPISATGGPTAPPAGG